MKKYLSLLFLFGVLANCYGNAGVFRGSGQTPILEKTADIQMAEEEITMRPRRGNYPVDTSCRNLDKMDFRCRFLLRNLTDKKVVLQVGFPLTAEGMLPDNGKDIDQSRIIAHYGFIAGTRKKTFPVRYAPWDKKRKFSRLFLWEMTFEPKQEIELLVNYTMEGYLGLGSARRNRHWKKRKKYQCGYLEFLAEGISQGQYYVTETGSSWAGKIEKAVFRYYPYEFEEYLARRGAWEETPAKRKQRLAEIRKHPGSFNYIFPPEMPVVRIWNPGYEQWQAKQGKYPGDRWLELVFQPFQPQKKDNIEIGYAFVLIPVNAEQFELFCDTLKTYLEQWAARKERARKSNPKDFEKY